ncbi:transposase, partial [Bacillus sp. 123MFChir2]|uniref:transposase n=1 Tax=Bacillus sp. 123MFChir2 TaxID=1169144 RepID=UPI0005542E10
RCSTIERSFADAKELHGYRYARFRGMKSVQIQAYLTAACQNMKKIALHLTRKGQLKGCFSYFLLFRTIFLYIVTIKVIRGWETQRVSQHSEEPIQCVESVLFCQHV